MSWLLFDFSFAKTFFFFTKGNGEYFCIILERHFCPSFEWKRQARTHAAALRRERWLWQMQPTADGAGSFRDRQKPRASITDTFRRRVKEPALPRYRSFCDLLFFRNGRYRTVKKLIESGTGTRFISDPDKFGKRFGGILSIVLQNNGGQKTLDISSHSYIWSFCVFFELSRGLIKKSIRSDQIGMGESEDLLRINWFGPFIDVQFQVKHRCSLLVKKVTKESPSSWWRMELKSESKKTFEIKSLTIFRTEKWILFRGKYFRKAVHGTGS